MSVYITGTDTGVGKTAASAALLHALRRDGRSAVGMKPVASGCEATPQGWRNADALALQAASLPTPPYAQLNPYALPEPTAPQLAARAAGTTVELAPLLAAFRELQKLSPRVVVEGVGGWLAPLADDLEQAELVRALDLPVVLVVGLKLGCLSHARLSARAIAADGCRLVGWIGSDIEPGPLLSADYFALVAQALPVPCLGRLPHLPGAPAQALSAHLASDWGLTGLSA